MDLNLKGKVILVSGGAGLEGSIGHTIIKSLVSEGAIPAIIDINARGQLYADHINNNGGDAYFVKSDVTDPIDLRQAVHKIVSKYGKIDAVINNVGVNDGVGIEASYDEFMGSLKLNMVSYWLTVKYALPELRKSKGVILNIGSKVGLTGQGGTSAYAASKGGVLALTREWALDLLKDEIRVNAIVIAECWTPSYDAWIKTIPNSESKLESIVKKIPFQNRMTTPAEIANTVLFVISEKSSHTTGQFIFVDGGYVHLDRALLSAE